MSHLGCPIRTLIITQTKLPFANRPASKSITGNNIIKKYDFLCLSITDLLLYAGIVIELRKIVDIVKKMLKISPIVYHRHCLCRRRGIELQKPFEFLCRKNMFPAFCHY